MTRFVSFPVAVAAALSVTLTGCGGGDKKTEDKVVETPSVGSTPTEKSPGVLVTRTTEELTTALLALSDLPTGFQQEKDDSDDGSMAFSAPTSRCKTLVKYLNATKAPGSKASVTRTFSGGQEGPYIDFGLDSMGTADEVADLRDAYAEAVDDCAKVTLKSAGQGNTSMKVEKITAPAYGTKPFAFRLTGTSGPKRGLEYTASLAGVADVIISVGVLAGGGTELAPATEAAVNKAAQVLKTT
jgi:hypothetical protein